MSIEQPWLARYPEGVPAEIDLNSYASIPEMLEETFRQFADRPAYANMGKVLTYRQLEQLRGHNKQPNVVFWI